MTLATATSALESRFDPFLYAAVREDPDRAPLTVLSILARLDIDPWNEAARLAQLPVEAAARALAGLISPLIQGLRDAYGQRNDRCSVDHSLAAPAGTRCRSARGLIWSIARDPGPEPGNRRRASGPESDCCRSATRQPVACGGPSGTPTRKEPPGSTRHDGSSTADEARRFAMRLVPARPPRLGTARIEGSFASTSTDSCFEAAFK